MYIYVLININYLIIKDILGASKIEFQCSKHEYQDYDDLLYPGNSTGCYKLGHQTNESVDFTLIEEH